MKNNIMAIMIGFFSLCLVSAQAQGRTPAADTSGVVIAVRGNVQLIRHGELPVKLRPKSVVGLNDVVRTGRRGRVQVSFPDGTIVRLDKNTQMSLTSYIYKPKEKKGKFVINVNEGVFRVMGGAITRIRPDRFKVKTPTATIGIRGSMFAAIANRYETSATFLGGKGIYVENNKGISEIGDAGLTVRARVGGRPGSAKRRIIISGFVPAAPKPSLEVDPDLGSTGVSTPLVPLVDAETGGVTLDPTVLVNRIVPPSADTNLTGYSIGFYDQSNVLSNTDSSHFRLPKTRSKKKTTGFIQLSKPAGLDGGIDSVNLDIDSNYSLSGDTRQVLPGGTISAFSDAAPEYMSWGKWNFNLVDTLSPSGGKPVKGYWVAGRKTRARVVKRLMDSSRNFVGNYSGKAFGTDKDGDYTGKFNLNADFSRRTFSGDISLENTPSFNMSGTITKKGFTGSLVGNNGSSVNGAFFGPKANAVGGSFRTGGALVGVFGGSGAVTSK